MVGVKWLMATTAATVCRAFCHCNDSCPQGMLLGSVSLQMCHHQSILAPSLTSSQNVPAGVLKASSQLSSEQGGMVLEREPGALATIGPH